MTLRALPMALLLLVAVPAMAFLVQSSQSGNQVLQLSWQQDEIPFRIDDAGSADLGPTVTARILRESFAAWEQIDGTSLRFRDEGLTSNTPAARRDRRNVVIFDETGEILGAPEGSGIIAVTRLNSDSQTGAILDADIIFNGLDFRFSENPAPGRVVLSDVAIHEIGHFIGLDHSPLGGPAQQRPTMNPFYFGDGPGEATSLAPDDITGARVLYPTTAFTNASGHIQGRVADADGAAVFGAHVMAENLDTGALHSTLSGADSGRQDPGAYTLHGLPPGPYRVHIEPLPSGLDESNFSDLFRNLDAGFPAEFHGNTAEPLLSPAVVVSAGARTRGIDFATGFVEPGIPFVRSVDGPGNTPDTIGPYRTFLDIVNAQRVWLDVDTDGQRSTLPADVLGDGLFGVSIPGRPVGSQIRYRVLAESDEGNRIEYPLDGSWLSFGVIGLSGSPLAFTVLRDDGVLGVFDTGSDGEVARVDVGEDPVQVLSSPDGRFLFVSNLGSSEISVIETATFRVASRILVAAQPLDMALSPDGSTLYVANSGASLLTAIDVESQTVNSFVSVGALADGPFGIAAGQDRVYVTDLNANQVLAVADGRVAARIDVADGPRSLALASDGDQLLVTSFGGPDLTIIDTATDRIEARIPMGVSGGFAVAVDESERRAYVTAHVEGVVVVVDLTTLSVVDRLPVGDNPRGLSFSPDGGRLFVTTAASNRIEVIDVASNESLGGFTALGGPRGISVLAAPEEPTSTSVAVDNTVPQQWQLSQAYPNPFNPATSLTVTVPRDGSVQLDVFDLLGQRIRRIDSGSLSAGTHRLRWDGLDGRGRPVGSGVYLLVATWDTSRLSRKVMLLR